MAYVVAARWVAKPGEIDAILEAVEACAAASRAEPGNVLYQAHRGAEDPNVLFFYEQYVDEAAFTAHTTTEHFQRYVINGAVPRLESRERAFYTTLDV